MEMLIENWPYALAAFAGGFALTILDIPVLIILAAIAIFSENPQFGGIYILGAFIALAILFNPLKSTHRRLSIPKEMKKELGKTIEFRKLYTEGNEYWIAETKY